MNKQLICILILLTLPLHSSGQRGKSNSAPLPPIESPLSKEQMEKFADASPEDITNENFPEKIESFDYPNADIADVIKAISQLTGKNFIIDPGVRGKISIVAPTPITVAEAYKAFLSAISITGYTVVPSGPFLKIKSSRNAQRDSIETYTGEYFPNTDQMITRIVQLKHISAEQVSKTLRILPSKDGELVAYPPTNSLIISDYGSNIERIMKIVERLDLAGFEDQMEVIPVRHAKSKDIAELIDQILNKDQGGRSTRGRSSRRGSSFSSGIPRFGAGNKSSNNPYFLVIPDERTNSLIVVGNTAGIRKIRRLIAKLDFRLRPEDAGGVYVYYMKHGEAKKIATTLNGIAKETTKKSTSTSKRSTPVTTQQIFGGDIQIVADESTNSLIVTASKQDYEVVLNLLRKIDIPRDQVYVEAIIMEMNMDDTNEWQIGYYQFDAASKGVGRAGFNGFKDISSFLSPTAGKGAILGFGAGSSVKIKVGSAETEVSSLMGFINFFKENARTNILSTPQIIAQDNEEALIEVGDKVPTSQSVQTGTNGTTSAGVNFEDATIRLKVKPFISPNSETIRLEIDQNIKQLSKKTPQAANLAGAASILTTRKIQTKVTVKSGDTIVLGGLIRDEETEDIAKVPILGDIPIIGWLFKRRNVTFAKTNLLVFLTPKIIRNDEQNGELVGRKLYERVDFVKKSGGRDPFGSRLEQLPRRVKVDYIPPSQKDIPTSDEVPEAVEVGDEESIESEASEATPEEVEEEVDEADAIEDDTEEEEESIESSSEEEEDEDEEDEDEEEDEEE